MTKQLNEESVLIVHDKEYKLEPSEIYTTSYKNIAEGDMVFSLPDKSEILALRTNGDIFVKGKLIENDKEVVDALREFLLKHSSF